MSCGVGCRRGSDPALQVAMAPIRPLAWESPHAAEAALEKAKRPKKKNDSWFIRNENLTVVIFTKSGNP